MTPTHSKESEEDAQSASAPFVALTNREIARAQLCRLQAIAAQNAW